MKCASLWQNREQNQFAAIDIYFAEHCDLSTEEDCRIAAELFAASRRGDLCISADRDLQSPHIHFHNQQLYLERNWILETEFINYLEKLRSETVNFLQPVSIEQLTETQFLAVQTACNSSISIIAGGPGTGKTFTALKLIDSVLKANPSAEIIVCAPTGKAAALFPSNGCRSGTIHSFLNLSPAAIARGETTYLRADLIIVDESSMIEAPLFCSLLGSIGENSRVVLMGDPQQLPPVGSGSLFADLVEAVKAGYQLPLIELKNSQRTNQPHLIELKEAISKGDEETVFRYLKGDYPDLSQIKKRDLESCCILSCLRKGPYGVDAINSYYSSDLSDKETTPILITRSDSNLRLYNGETGLLIEGKAYFSLGRVIPISRLPPFEYAYAISVHKSQGSEYDRVVLIVPEGSEVFGREILYTAVTRTKKEIEIYGKKKTIKEMLHRGSRKISGLQGRLVNIPLPDERPPNWLN